MDNSAEIRYDIVVTDGPICKPRLWMGLLPRHCSQLHISSSNMLYAIVILIVALSTANAFQMSGRSVASSALRMSAPEAPVPPTDRVLNVIEGGDKGACALRCNFLED